MTKYFENCLKDLEIEFGFEYDGDLNQNCTCHDCSDVILAEIRQEMEETKHLECTDHPCTDCQERAIDRVMSWEDLLRENRAEEK